ncbi:unnamed protein product [Clavelina lepadiformis]|uniref:Polybromo-1 n=1 Tax=Clavelina lepadiformis TaxID=159417 RepID=A0ABP0H648_CLALP
MPPKRKHLSSGRDSSFSESPYSKRPRRSAANQSDLALLIYEAVKGVEDEYGHVISDSFMKLPSKRHHPDYYDKIVDPVDLTKIGQRIRMEEYRDIEILTTDFQLMVSNAKKYYDENSQEYNDACSLWEIYLTTKARMVEEAKLQEAAKPKPGRKPKQLQQTNDDQHSGALCIYDFEVTMEDLKELYENLVTETDEAGRVIADLFMQLPDRSNEDYYEKIKEPIDFLTIGENLENGKYFTIAELEKDIMLLARNARTYNERHSQMYDDATMLKSIFRERASDLEKIKKPEIVGVKTSARIKHRKSFSRTSDRLQDRPLKSEEKSELHDASIPHPALDEFQAQLYNEVVNYKNHLGHTISDPFVRLPNKRFYPMYYEEIENPISLKIIRKKIQTKKYDSCEDLQEDFNLLFSNAKKFNVGTSQIHKDAVALQKFMEVKLPEYAAKEEELADIESESDDEENNVQNERSRVEDKGDDVLTDSMVDDTEFTKKKRRRKQKGSKRESLQDRLRLLYETVLAAEDEEGNEMITLFLEKPSRKDYPDYYKLVLEPIDMRIIDKKIRQDKYINIDDMLDDFNLMFNNARHYNEPGSQVYMDADALEKILVDKNKELGSFDITLPSARSSKTQGTSLEEKLMKLFNAIRDYADPTQRKICDIFMHLPTKHELPDYYKVIKKPMEMDRIQQRIQTGQYTKLDEMLADLLLMYENACIYNEPGSVIYKDALILQKVAVEKYYEFEEVETNPSIENLVQEMMTSLFMSVMNHQDENGRCYSESLGTTVSSSSNQEGDSGSNVKSEQTSTDSPSNEHVENSDNLTFEKIKKNLHNRRYRRLDVFQEHMFEVFEDVRSNNRTDSEVYEDTVELQKFFIKIRDELCKNGEILMSPTRSHTLKRLENELDVEKKEKQQTETKEDEEMQEEGKEMREKMEMTLQSERMDYQGTMYKPGDYVYVENQESMSTPHIVCIEKLYTDDSGERRLYGGWYYRPEATFHTTTKKFFVKEVFKSDYYNTVLVTLIRGRCVVMPPKNYFKMKPVGFNEEDVYICESRYFSNHKTFKRLKTSQLPTSDVELELRETPLPIIRISSCYSNQKDESLAEKERVQSYFSQGIDESWPKDVIDRERENIKSENQLLPDGVYYSQYFTNDMWVKLGDCVYLRQPNTSVCKIARVDYLWTDAAGNVLMRGPWFIRPEETQHEPTRMFYKNELFISSSEATFLFANVTGKCMVLAAKDYVACRPTEIAEKDIFYYESKYVEAEGFIKKIKSIKRYTPTHKVVDDEYYYYKRLIPAIYQLSPFLEKAVQDEMINRENDAKNMKEHAETDETSSSISGDTSAAYAAPSAQGHMYPPIQQPPHAYPPPPHVMPSHPYSPHPGYPPQIQYAGSPAPGDPHAQQSHQPYMHQQMQHQQYPPGMRPSIPPPAVPPPHMPQYTSSPHMYSASPHPGIMAPSPGVIQSPDSSRPSSARPEAAPTPPTKKKTRSGHSTGYILFASHYHPKARADHPEMPFGEISKIVGEEWRNLDEDKKREYEEKAREQTARLEAEGKLVVKKKKKKKDADESVPATPQPVLNTPGQQYAPQAYPQGQYQVTPGHPQVPRPPVSTPQASPYTSQPYPGTMAPASYMQTPTAAHQYVQHPQATPVNQPPPPPTVAQQHRMKRGALFVKPPPKAQRVMHSEAYLRYIEGLEKGSSSISNWQKTLNVQQKDVHLTKEEETKLPVHWLANGKGRHESTTAALWSLRNLMLKDALTIRNHLAW